MATAYLMASRPGAFSDSGRIKGNPEATATVSLTGSYQQAFALTPGLRHRLLQITADAECSVVQLTAGETTGAFSGVATKIPPPSSGLIGYACEIHPSTVSVQIKTP